MRPYITYYIPYYVLNQNNKLESALLIHNRDKNLKAQTPSFIQMKSLQVLSTNTLALLWFLFTTDIRHLNTKFLARCPIVDLPEVKKERDCMHMQTLSWYTQWNISEQTCLSLLSINQMYVMKILKRLFW